MINTHHSPNRIDPEKLPDPLVELLRVVHTQLPAEHLSILEPQLDLVIEDTRRRIGILALIQESIAQIRLDVKYLAFDLEATRRERDEALR